MSAFSKIRQSLGKRSLIKKQKKRIRNRVVHNFNTAKRVAVVFDTTDQETFRHIREFSKFLERSGIASKVLGYVDLEEIPGDFGLWENCQVICKRDLDYFFRPKDENILKFTDMDYDILFDLSMNDFFPLSYITVLSRAKFKVGRYKETYNDSDFMINISGEPTVEFLIGQINNYVSILNNPRETGKVSTK